ncbi:MAG: NAD(P) transhydrogenase subunit alpha [Hyphomonadaceae bacterium]|nr:NAD(P) transhydrogenase subunit alpha [Hyphomonadaceae bacterium]
MEAVDPIIFRLAIFVLAIFVGYYVVWSVTPALHTPLMSVTNAISSVIIVGAIIAAAAGAAATGPSSRDIDKACGGIIKAFDAADKALAPPELWMPARDREGLAGGCRQHYGEVSLQRLSQPPEPGAKVSTWIAQGAGVLAALLASVNIFGGFLVTQRMLAMYKKKDKPVAKA